MNKIKITILGKFECQSYPLIEGKTIYCTQDELDQIGTTLQFDVENLKVIPYDNTEDLKQAKLQELRGKRASECFPIINRGQLWYNTLTEKQLKELNKWYQEWLDVTDTLKEPEKPEWLI